MARCYERTRNALIAAARQLLAEGVTPTVERTADRAGVSRTTAFRYFPNQRALLVAAYPQIEERSRLGSVAPEDPMARWRPSPRSLRAKSLITSPSCARSYACRWMTGRAASGSAVP